MLRTGRYAQAATMTLVRMHGKRLAIAVGPRFDACCDRKRSTLCLGELSHRKDVVRAHANTVLLALAFRAVNDWNDYSGFFPAIVFT
jgi:hypothetical protein